MPYLGNHMIINSKNFHQKHFDQRMLRKHVYPLIKNNSTIHDSYLCKIYKDSVGFPSKRIGSCFIGGVSQNTTCENENGKKCPVECRPIDHKDLINCFDVLEWELWYSYKFV